MSAWRGIIEKKAEELFLPSAGTLLKRNCRGINFKSIATATYFDRSLLFSRERTDTFSPYLYFYFRFVRQRVLILKNTASFFFIYGTPWYSLSFESTSLWASLLWSDRGFSLMEYWTFSKQLETCLFQQLVRIRFDGIISGYIYTTSKNYYF